jgi:hypothetical protein
MSTFHLIIVMPPDPSKFHRSQRKKTIRPRPYFAVRSFLTLEQVCFPRMPPRTSPCFPDRPYYRPETPNPRSPLRLACWREAVLSSERPSLVIRRLTHGSAPEFSAPIWGAAGFARAKTSRASRASVHSSHPMALTFNQVRITFIASLAYSPRGCPAWSA